MATYGHGVPDALDHHWCDTSAEDWAEEYFQRAGKGGSALARLQLLAHRHFYGALPTDFLGDMPSSAEVTRAGEQFENVELRVNWLRAHQNAKQQIITAPKMTWGAQCANTDSRSMADAARGATILEAEWKQGPWERAAIDARLGAGIYGEEFVFVYWLTTAGEAIQYINAQPAVEASPGAPPDEANPAGMPPVEARPAAPSRVEYTGDLVCHQVSSWNAFCDETSPSWIASPWKSARVLEDRWDLIARFPDKRDEILAASESPGIAATGPGNTTVNVDGTGKVLCHYFFHKRTPGLPRGLQAVALSPECVLEFLPLAKRHHTPPIHQAKDGVLKGSPRGYTNFWEAMAAQSLATNIQGSLATNIVTFAKQFVSAEDGSNLAPDRIGNGPQVVYRPKGTAPPVPVMFHLPNEAAFKHLDVMRSDQRMMLGLNDVSMGEAPTGTPNAQAWALLATAGVTANSGGQQDQVQLVRAIGQSILAAWKEMATHQRKTSVIGVHGAAVPKQEAWDKTTFEPMGDVTVEIASPLSQTAAGRLQIEQLFAERGFILTPEQLTMLVETGSLKPLTQVLRDELIYIAWENEQILKGICPEVMVTDSQQMHIREHKAPTFSAEARGNPAIIEAANKHIEMHVQQALSMTPQLAQLLGQAAPAPMAPAAPGGSSGGAAGALEQPGAAGPAPEGVKLPTAPVDPVTGSAAGAPGMAA